MPRDGAGDFTKLYPDVVTGTTISSSVHNGTINDFVTDANTVRPIKYGGTGANNATVARTNLKAEASSIQVSNYDMHVFESGSFWSAPGATAAPNGTDYFFGVAVIGTDSAVAVSLQARSMTDGKLYSRRKWASTWQDSGVWKVEGEGDYVNVTGDTMTGNLTISMAAWPGLILNNTGTGSGMLLSSQRNNLQRWQVRLDDETPETGGGAGSDLSIYRCDDAGNAVERPFVIQRSNGQVQTPNAPIYNHSVVNKLYADTKVSKTGDTMSGPLTVYVPGNQFGGAGGDATTPLTSNTNILLYNNGATNWAGMGADTGGNMYFVTGVGAPATRMFISNAGNVGIGVLSPSRKLEVGGLMQVTENAALTGISLNNTSGGGRQIQLLAGTGAPAFGVYDTAAGWRLMIDSAGVVSIPGGTNSSSPTTGALVVAGGVGIGAQLSVQFDIKMSTPYTAAGGWGLYFGDGGSGSSVYIDTKGNSLNFRCGSAFEVAYARSWLFVDGATGVSSFYYRPTVPGLLSNNDVSINQSAQGSPNTAVLLFGNTGGKYLYFDGTNLNNRAGPFIIEDTTASTSPSTGALRVNGGLGVLGDAYYNAHVNITRAVNAICLQVANNGGGLGTDAVRISMVNMTDGTSYQAIAYNNSHGWRFIVRGNGNCENVNNSYGGISDVRHKRDIADAPSLLDRIMAVKVRSYHMEHDDDDAPSRIGVVSQEIEELFPDLVYEDAEGKKYFSYSNLWPRMLKAFQEHVIETRRRH